MADSRISWCTKVWNPVVGCTRVSAGCERCYAEAYAPRLAAMGQSEYDGLTRKHGDGSVNWTGDVRCLPERLEIPLHWRKPQRVFANSMSDLFHEAVPDEFIDKVFAIMSLCLQHTFMILTKRPERMQAYMTEQWQADSNGWKDDRYGAVLNWIGDSIDGRALVDSDDSEKRWAPFIGTDLLNPRTDLPIWPLPNVWFGTSTEDQATADERIPLLLQTPAAVRFLSCEPLLGPIDLSKWMWALDPPPGRGLPTHKGPDWIITGAESGHNRRPYDLDWARSLRDQCTAAGVPFFYKQGSSQWPGQFDQLDGREWREFPR